MSTSSKFREGRQYKNWKEEILPEILKRQKIHFRQGIAATVRGLLYVLISKGILDTKDYQSLSVHLTDWRDPEQNKNGIPLVRSGWILDNTRRILDIINYEEKGRRINVGYDEKIQSLDDIVTPAEHIKCGIDYLRDSINDWYNNIPKWMNQPKYLEDWIEKNAMAPSFRRILNTKSKHVDDEHGLRIVIAPNGGWSSYTFFVENNLPRLREKQKQGKEVYIQYYGDSDPSGERMTAPDSDMVRKLERYGINFERIAVTDQTIEDFDMEKVKIATMYDPKIQAKLEGTGKEKGNPNTPWFKRKHGTHRAWQIELDALLLNLDKFTDLVLSNAKKHFDEDIHKQMLEDIKIKYPENEARDELNKQLKGLARELGLNCY